MTADQELALRVLIGIVVLVPTTVVVVPVTLYRTDAVIIENDYRTLVVYSNRILLRFVVLPTHGKNSVP